LPWETASPAPGWFRLGTSRDPPSACTPYTMCFYINVILLVRSKSMRTKFCKIKSKKITTAYKTFSTNDPAKRDPERMIIEPTMLNFRPG